MATAPAPSVVESDERRLVVAAAAGDAAAFEQLYRRHVRRIHGLCCQLSNGDSARAAQATQDAFVRAWERLGSFRGESEFGTWLHRLTVNVVLGEQRLMRRWVNFDDMTAGGEWEEQHAQHPQATAGLKLDLERALARLPPGARVVLILHDVEGYQHDEIANLTGIAIGTSKAQLHRARKLMQEWLK